MSSTAICFYDMRGYCRNSHSCPNLHVSSFNQLSLENNNPIPPSNNANYQRNNNQRNNNQRNNNNNYSQNPNRGKNNQNIKKFKPEGYLGKKIKANAKEGVEYDLYPFQISFTDIIKRCIQDCTILLHKIIVMMMRSNGLIFNYYDYDIKKPCKLKIPENFEISSCSYDLSTIVSNLISSEAQSIIHLNNKDKDEYIASLIQIKDIRHGASHGQNILKMAKEDADTVIFKYSNIIRLLKETQFREIAEYHEKCPEEFRKTFDDLKKLNSAKYNTQNLAISEKKNKVQNAMNEIQRIIANADTDGESEEFLTQIFHDLCLRMPSLLNSKSSK